MVLAPSWVGDTSGVQNRRFWAKFVAWRLDPALSCTIPTLTGFQASTRGPKSAPGTWADLDVLILEQARNYLQRGQQVNAREEEISTAALLAFVHARRKEEPEECVGVLEKSIGYKKTCTIIRESRCNLYNH